MYAGVPSGTPGCVRAAPLVASAAVIARAIPKSATTAWPALKQDVLRLDVAMDQPGVVRVAERVRHFAGDL